MECTFSYSESDVSEILVALTLVYTCDTILRNQTKLK